MLIDQQATAIDACHAHDASGLSSAQRHLIVRPIGLPAKQLELLQ